MLLNSNLLLPQINDLWGIAAVLEVLFLAQASLTDEVVDLATVSGSEGFAVFAEIADEGIQLGEQALPVLHKEVCPHLLIHGRNASHVVEASP